MGVLLPFASFCVVYLWSACFLNCVELDYFVLELFLVNFLCMEKTKFFFLKYFFANGLSKICWVFFSEGEIGKFFSEKRVWYRIHIPVPFFYHMQILSKWNISFSNCYVFKKCFDARKMALGTTRIMIELSSPKHKEIQLFQVVKYGPFYFPMTLHYWTLLKSEKHSCVVKDTEVAIEMHFGCHWGRW